LEWKPQRGGGDDRAMKKKQMMDIHEGRENSNVLPTHK